MDARVERMWSAQIAEQDVAAIGAECNGWLIGDDDEVIVIDPGDDAEAVFEQVGDREIVAVICCAAQLVGLNMKSGRSMSTVTRCKRNGTPKTICGSAYGPVSSVVIVRSEVVGSTLILARTTTRPRLNGPATAFVTMLSPNGAPSYGPVM